MSTCNTPFASLSAYVDAELAPESELELRRHLDSCPRCRDVVDMLEALKKSVAATAEVRPVPHSLRERVAALDRPASTRRRWFGRIALAASACAVVLAVYAWRAAAPRTTLESTVVEALVADHVHFRDAPDAPQVRSADPAEVGAWFEGKLPFRVALPRLRNASLVGGRLCSLWGQKVAVGFYETQGERVSLFAADAARFPSPIPDAARCDEGLGSYRVCVAPAGDTVLLMVADSARASLLLPELEADTRPEAADTRRN
jgi:anti-sigma factor (TIGR02949 family)